MHKKSLSIWILFFCICTSFAFSQLEKVSQTVQKLSKYAIERTVAIKIHIGNRYGFGSGALVSPDGIIITCAHVVEPAQKLTVVTSDKKEYPAKRLGLNSRNDYAIIKIDGKNLPYFQRGNSEKLSLLQWVVGLGHPGGPYADLQPAVAIGRIRGLHKKLPIQFGAKYYDDAIQSDVPIFAGNSGGPLIDLSGKLIGINGAIMLVNDLAFSVPINEIEHDLETMISGKDVQGRAPGNIWKIMFEMQEDFSPEDMTKLFDKGPFGRILKLFLAKPGQLPRKVVNLGVSVTEAAPEGLVVIAVNKNKIGAMAGIAVGDVLLKIDDKTLSLRDDLTDILEKVPAKGKIFVSLKRDKKKMKLPVYFDRKAYSRDNYLKRKMVYNGLSLLDSTVRLMKGNKLVGYGTVISKDGWILTANHILNNMGNSVAVQMQSNHGKIYPGAIIGRNGVLDVAIIKIDAVTTPVNLGDDKKVKVGQWVVSGGNADGIVRGGMISALNRAVSEKRRVPTLGLFGMFGQPNKSPIRAYDKVIQHDTNMESHQFGTPVVDMQGNLVALNVGHFYRGTTYAIPISSINNVLADLKAGKAVAVASKYIPRPAKLDPLSRTLRRVFDDLNNDRDPLGSVFRELFRAFGGPKGKGFIGVQVQAHSRGVEVVEAVKGYPAQKAGLKKGDVIITLGDFSIGGVEDLQSAVQSYKPGKVTTISVLRPNKDKFVRKEFTIRIGRRKN